MRIKVGLFFVVDNKVRKIYLMLPHYKDIFVIT